MGGCISKQTANTEADDEIVDHETKGKEIFENFLLAVYIEVFFISLPFLIIDDLYIL